MHIYGTRGRNRTCGQQLRRLLLYPLSYAGVRCEKAGPSGVSPSPRWRGRIEARANSVEKYEAGPKTFQEIRGFPYWHAMSLHQTKAILERTQKKFKAIKAKGGKFYLSRVAI